MERIEIDAQYRAEKGKGFSRKCRKNGLIPAIFYGPKTDPISLTLDAAKVEKVLRILTHKNAIVDLRISGKGEMIKKVAILKDHQRNPITRSYMHADFYEIVLDKEITVSIAIHLSGKPVGIDEGGILNQIQREVEAKCLPLSIPDNFDIDVSGLEIGQSVRVEDIPSVEGVQVITEKNIVVAAVVAPTVEVEGVEGEEEEVAEGEETGEEAKSTTEKEEKTES